MPIVRFALLTLFLVLASGCATTPQAPGIEDDVLDALTSRYGEAARQRLIAWRHLIASHRDQPLPLQLAAVNDFINRLHFEDDILHWQREDYWATPIETLVTQGGDCEDFALAKYATLRELGVADACLRLVYVKAQTLNKAHMVLTYQCQREDPAWVLDNLNPQILTTQQRDDLVPVYSFNKTGLWLAGAQGMGRQVGEASRLSAWVDWLQRMHWR